MHKKWRARQRTELAGPYETPQKRSNHLRRERRIVQQAVARAQPSLGNDALQLIGDRRISLGTMGLWKNAHNLWIL
jgi:hypothetical protein